MYVCVCVFVYICADFQKFRRLYLENESINRIRVKMYAVQFYGLPDFVLKKAFSLQIPLNFNY